MTHLVEVGGEVAGGGVAAVVVVVLPSVLLCCVAAKTAVLSSPFCARSMPQPIAKLLRLMTDKPTNANRAKGGNIVWLVVKRASRDRWGSRRSRKKLSQMAVHRCEEGGLPAVARSERMRSNNECASHSCAGARLIRKVS